MQKKKKSAAFTHVREKYVFHRLKLLRFIYWPGE